MARRISLGTLLVPSTVLFNDKRSPSPNDWGALSVGSLAGRSLSRPAFFLTESDGAASDRGDLAKFRQGGEEVRQPFRGGGDFGRKVTFAEFDQAGAPGADEAEGIILLFRDDANEGEFAR